MTQLKIDIVYSLFMGSFLTACLTFFINYCIENPGRIFGQYKVWLASRILTRYIKGWKFRLLRRFAKPIEHTEGLNISATTSKWTKEEKYIAYSDIRKTMIEAASPLAFWEKPLGMCMYCMNPYLCFITIWLTEIPNLVCMNWMLIWMFIAYPTLSNFFLHKID